MPVKRPVDRFYITAERHTQSQLTFQLDHTYFQKPFVQLIQSKNCHVSVALFQSLVSVQASWPS